MEFSKKEQKPETDLNTENCWVPEWREQGLGKMIKGEREAQNFSYGINKSQGVTCAAWDGGEKGKL